jgi:hypothetical protein
MARRVFLHVGVPKSGTTYLQTAMWHNRAALRAQGFLYPGARRMEHFHASQDIRSRPEHSTGAWERLRTQVREWHGDALISHEFFGMARPPQARTAVRQLAPAEVHVVLTARDYVRQFPAVWQEALKMTSELTLDEFMEKAFAGGLQGAWSWRSQDVPAILERWGSTVRPERLHVVTVPPASAPRELLWERWREVLGIDDTAFDLARSFSNESLGAPQAALLWRINSFFSGDLKRKSEQHRWVRQYLAHEVLGPQKGPRFGLRPDHAAELRRRSLEAVGAIRDSGCRVVGDLADLVPDEDQPDQPNPQDVTDDELLDVAGRTIDQMVHDVRRLTSERDHWRALARQRTERRPTQALVRAARKLRRRVGA